MTATGHAVIGVVIAAVFPNPVIAIPLAVGSHILADLFPHWDPATNRKDKTKNEFLRDAIIDGIMSIIAVFLLVYFVFPQTNLFYAYVMAFASQFLDWASAPYVFFKITNPPVFYWFYKFQKMFDNKLDKPWGIIGQAGFLLILVFLAASVLDYSKIIPNTTASPLNTTNVTPTHQPPSS